MGELTATYETADKEASPAREAATVLPQEPPKPILPKVEIDQTFDGYRFEKQLGRGGMGVVWAATEISSGRKVALKLLAKSVIKEKGAVERFIREGQLAAQLSHPRSTFVYKAGEVDGQPYIIMELMPGDTLQEVIDEKGMLPVNQAIDYILDAIDGLIAAHQLGIIHRDVKPSNCFVDHDGRVKVGDFGLSRTLVSDVSLTQTGTFMGTPLYAAPEQIRGDKVDERTDLYSITATLYRMIAGRAAFSGDAIGVTAQIISDSPPSIREFAPECPKALESIINRGLEKKPEDRFRDLETLRSALAPYASGASSVVDLGRRLAAFLIDITIVTLVFQIVFSILGGVIGFMAGINSNNGAPVDLGDTIPKLQLVSGLVSWGVLLCYFCFLEGRYGATIGKWLMGMRVADSQSEPAGLIRCLIRAFIVPSGIGIPILWYFYRYSGGELLGEPLSGVSAKAASINLVVEMGMRYFLPIILLISMKPKNGFRALHEFLSDTRTLSVNRKPDSLRRRNIPMMRPTPTSNEKIGQYEVAGIMGKTSSGHTVYQARDSLLNRNVWIFVHMENVDLDRINLGRIGRIRWLNRGMFEDKPWHAFESIDGVPLKELIDAESGFAWGQSRFVLMDLAKELSASESDSSLPQTLSLDQIWVDATGNAKLLDEAILSESDAPESENLDSRELFSHVFQACQGNQIIPIAASETIQKFNNHESNFSELAEDLEAQTEKLAKLSWDLRFGALAITMSLEMAIISIVSLVLGYFVTSTFGFSIIWNSLMLLPILGVIPFLVAYLSRNGSPIFDLCGIKVVRSDGSRATQIRYGIRNLIAWLPALYVTSLGVSFFQVSFLQIQLGSAIQEEKELIEKYGDVLEGTTKVPEIPSKSKHFSEKEKIEIRKRAKEAKKKIENIQGQQNEIGNSFKQNFVVGISVLFAALFFVIMHLVGPIFSVVNPSRGIQDLIAGTRLINE